MVRTLTVFLTVTAAAWGKVKLTYFPVAGRGELSRLLAAVGGLAMVDSFDTANYATDTPFGFLPMLEDSDSGLFQLQESLAIERYISAVAPQFHQLTPAQRAVDDEFACAKEDLMVVESCAVNVSAARACVPPIFDRYLGILEKLVPGSGFVHGLEFPTGADLATLIITQAGFPWGRAKRLAGYSDQWQMRFPKVAALSERTAAAPAVAAYLAESATFYAKMEPTHGLMIDPAAAVTLVAGGAGAASSTAADARGGAGELARVGEGVVVRGGRLPFVVGMLAVVAALMVAAALVLAARPTVCSFRRSCSHAACGSSVNHELDDLGTSDVGGSYQRMPGTAPDHE